MKCLNGLSSLIVDNVDFLRLLSSLTPSEYLFAVINFLILIKLINWKIIKD